MITSRNISGNGWSSLGLVAFTVCVCAGVFACKLYFSIPEIPSEKQLADYEKYLYSIVKNQVRALYTEEPTATTWDEDRAVRELGYIGKSEFKDEVIELIDSRQKRIIEDRINRELGDPESVIYEDVDSIWYKPQKELLKNENLERMIYHPLNEDGKPFPLSDESRTRVMDAIDKSTPTLINSYFTIIGKIRIVQKQDNPDIVMLMGRGKKFKLNGVPMIRRDGGSNEQLLDAVRSRSPPRPVERSK